MGVCGLCMYYYNKRKERISMKKAERERIIPAQGRKEKKHLFLCVFVSFLFFLRSDYAWLKLILGIRDQFRLSLFSFFYGQVSVVYIFDSLFLFIKVRLPWFRAPDEILVFNRITDFFSSFFFVLPSVRAQSSLGYAYVVQNLDDQSLTGFYPYQRLSLLLYQGGRFSISRLWNQS